MIEILIAVLIVLTMSVFTLVYYSLDQIKEKKPFKSKISSIVKRTRNEYIVVTITVVLGLATWIIGRYLYKHDSIWIYKWIVAISALTPIAAIDFKKKIIPNKLLLIMIAYTVVIYAVQIILNTEYVLSILGSAFIGLLLGGGVFLLASLFVKNGIGAGDIKLYGILGFLLAFRGIFNVLLYSMIVSAITGIVLLISKKKKTKDSLPLAPFTLIGVTVAIILGV